MGLILALWTSGKSLKTFQFKLHALRGLSVHIQHRTLILRNINDENIRCVLSHADPRSLATRPSAPGLGVLTCVLRSEGMGSDPRLDGHFGESLE